MGGSGHREIHYLIQPALNKQNALTHVTMQGLGFLGR